MKQGLLSVKGLPYVSKNTKSVCLGLSQMPCVTWTAHFPTLAPQECDHREHYSS